MWGVNAQVIGKPTATLINSSDSSQRSYSNYLRAPTHVNTSSIKNSSGDSYTSKGYFPNPADSSKLSAFPIPHNFPRRNCLVISQTPIGKLPLEGLKSLSSVTRYEVLEDTIDPGFIARPKAAVFTSCSSSITTVSAGSDCSSVD